MRITKPRGELNVGVGLFISLYGWRGSKDELDNGRTSPYFTTTLLVPNISGSTRDSDSSRVHVESVYRTLMQ